jgi:hypothetical protein
LVKAFSSIAGIQTTNQLAFEKFDLEKMLLGFLRVLLFFQRIKTRIHITLLKSRTSDMINNYIISEFSFPISLHGYGYAGIEIIVEIILLNRKLVLQTDHEL